MPTSQSTLKVRSSALMGFSQLCRTYHVNPIKLLEKEGLSASVLRSPDILIPYDSFARALNRAATKSQSPLFGLTLSQRQGPKILGPLGLLAGQCETFADSLAIIQKYVHFHAQGVRLNLEVQDNEARLTFDVSLKKNIGLTQLIELSVGLSRSVLQALAPPGMKVTRVLFQHEALAPALKYEELLKVEACFAEKENAIVFPSSYLNQAPTPASDEVRDYLESFLEHAGEGHDQPLKHKVAKLIHELIPTGEATVPTVAGLLGMHTRGLQRELNSSGTEFRTLLEEVRFNLARETLEMTRMPLTDLALHLGYSELSAFSRAFKRWSGIPPQQWRDQQTGMTD